MRHVALRTLSDAHFRFHTEGERILAGLEEPRPGRAGPALAADTLAFATAVVLPHLDTEQDAVLGLLRGRPETEAVHLGRELVEDHRTLMNAIVAIRHFLETGQETVPALRAFALALRDHARAVEEEVLDWVEVRGAADALGDRLAAFGAQERALRRQQAIGRGDLA